MNYLIIAALLPAILLLLYIRKQDKIEAEPFGLILKLFLFGALTVIGAALIELILLSILGVALNTSSLAYKIIENFLIIAMAEESLKRLVMKKITWKSPEFNYTYDAVVYAVAVSLGFAAAENLMYVFDGGIKVAVLRAFTAVPGHMIFGIFMGLHYGIAKKAEMLNDHSLMKKHLHRSLTLPVLIHGFYDLCLSMKSLNSILIFFAFFILSIIFAFSTVKKLSLEDTAIYQTDESKTDTFV